MNQGTGRLRTSDQEGTVVAVRDGLLRLQAAYASLLVVSHAFTSFSLSLNPGNASVSLRLFVCARHDIPYPFLLARGLVTQSDKFTLTLSLTVTLTQEENSKRAASE